MRSRFWHWLLLSSVCTMAGCDGTVIEPGTSKLAFACHTLLIGLASESCREDVRGPGVLRIAVSPDPPEGSWEIAISGLAGLAEACEFHGSFDQTRLSALQGRGPTELVCPIDETIDRGFHELNFRNLVEAPNSSIAIAVTFERIPP